MVDAYIVMAVASLMLSFDCEIDVKFKVKAKVIRTLKGGKIDSRKCVARQKCVMSLRSG